MADLGNLGGAVTTAYAINNGGQAVGDSWVAVTQTQFISHAFRTAANSTINPATDDLGTMVTGGSSFAYGINNLGQVVGQGNVAGSVHAYRTTPGGVISRKHVDGQGDQ